MSEELEFALRVEKHVPFGRISDIEKDLFNQEKNVRSMHKYMCVMAERIVELERKLEASQNAKHK